MEYFCTAHQTATVNDHDDDDDQDDGVWLNSEGMCILEKDTLWHGMACH